MPDNLVPNPSPFAREDALVAEHYAKIEEEAMSSAPSYLKGGCVAPPAKFNSVDSDWTIRRKLQLLSIAVNEHLNSLAAGPFDFSTGVCCCGDDMSTHNAYSGHDPVDSGLYWYDQSVSHLRSLL